MSLENILQPQYQYVAKLDPATKEVIREYTGTEFEDLNYRLRTKKSLEPDQRTMVKLLDRAFLAAPVLTDTIVVYRGINRDLVSEVLAYISTSGKLNQAIEFTNRNTCCLLRITVTPGTKVLPIKYISESKYENEILLPRFGKIIITREFYYENIKTYDLTFLPEKTITATPLVTETKVEEILGEEIWTNRLVSMIDPQELEFFTLEELVKSLVDTSFKDEQVPPKAIVAAIARYRTTL